MRGALATLVLCLALPAGAGANLLVNPDFDVDLAGWSGSGTWDPFDVAGDSASGSVLLLGSESLGQCLPVSPGTFLAGAHVFLPSGQVGTGRIWVNVRFHDQPACGGHGFNQQLFAALVPFDAWTFVPGSATDRVPDGAVSAAFGLDLVQESSDFRAYFDAAELQLPEPRPLLLLAAAIGLGAARHQRSRARPGS